TCLPAAPMVADPIIEYAQQNDITSIAAINAGYPWGFSFAAALEGAVADADGIELEMVEREVPETDFTSALREFEDLDPGLIVATGHPPGAGPITVQSADLGFEVPVLGAYSQWTLAVGGAPDVAIDRYADFDCADFQSDDYQELA